MKTIRVLFALPCLLLAACQVTTFEKPPLVAETACDPVLVGRWWSVSEGGPTGDDGEVRLTIAPDCELTFTEREADGTLRTDPPTRLYWARHGAHAYAWVDAAWAVRHVGEEEDLTVPAGDVALVRYAAEGDQLVFWSTDDKAIAHAIVDGEISGETHVADSDITNRISESAPVDVLDRPGFFDAEAARMRPAPEN